MSDVFLCCSSPYLLTWGLSLDIDHWFGQTGQLGSRWDLPVSTLAPRLLVCITVPGCNVDAGDLNSSLHARAGYVAISPAPNHAFIQLYFFLLNSLYFNINTPICLYLNFRFPNPDLQFLCDFVSNFLYILPFPPFSYCVHDSWHIEFSVEVFIRVMCSHSLSFSICCSTIFL